MRKHQKLFLKIIVLLIPLILCSVQVNAQDAGVGVLNVSVTTDDIRINPHDNTIRVYGTFSDYNSNDDIYRVHIYLEYYGLETAHFVFQHYPNPESYVKSNEFIEKSTEKNLLQIEKCTFHTSTRRETVEEKCNLELLFVFRTTWFTRMRVEAEDRGGKLSTTIVDFNTEELMRSENMIMIPGFDGPILLGISSFVINFIAILIGALGALYFGRKMNLFGIGEYGQS